MILIEDLVSFFVFVQMIFMDVFSYCHIDLILSQINKTPT